MANVPLGYKFHPTKEELLYYLFCFVSKKPLPCDGVIPVADLYGKEPWEVCGGNCHETEYFFTPLKKASNKGSRFARTVSTGKGTWSGKTKIEKIYNRRNQIIGYSKDLKYQNKGSPEDGLWIMREYSLGQSLKRHAKDEFKDYVLVRIRRKESENHPKINVATSENLRDGAASSQGTVMDREVFSWVSIPDDRICVSDFADDFLCNASVRPGVLSF